MGAATGSAITGFVVDRAGLGAAAVTAVAGVGAALLIQLAGRRFLAEDPAAVETPVYA